jgi:hypothetical protein
VNHLDWLNSERVMRLIGFSPSPLRPPPCLDRASSASHNSNQLAAYEGKSKIIGIPEFMTELKAKPTRRSYLRQLARNDSLSIRMTLESMFLKKSKSTRKLRALKHGALGLHVLPLHAIADGRCSCLAAPHFAHPGKQLRTSCALEE